jgi:hypothetical protein
MTDASNDSIADNTENRVKTVLCQRRMKAVTTVL